MDDCGIFVYVSNAESKEIFVLRLDAKTGNLAPVGEVAVSGKAMSIAVSSYQQFLAAFGVDLATGMLSHVVNYPTERQPPEFANY